MIKNITVEKILIYGILLFWTFILNCLCKAGYKEISWILLLLPFILFFIITALIFLTYSTEVY